MTSSIISCERLSFYLVQPSNCQKVASLGSGKNFVARPPSNVISTYSLTRLAQRVTPGGRPRFFVLQSQKGLETVPYHSAKWPVGEV